jgi:hypothetical protein
VVATTTTNARRRSRLPVVCAGSVQVKIEMTRESDPVTGKVSTRDRESREFTGWLELMSMLEEARVADADQGADR